MTEGRRRTKLALFVVVAGAGFAVLNGVTEFVEGYTKWSGCKDSRASCVREPGVWIAAVLVFGVASLVAGLFPSVVRMFESDSGSADTTAVDTFDSAIREKYLQLVEADL